MSLLHGLIYYMIKRGKQEYISGQTPDYEARRRQERRVPDRRPPRGVSVENKLISGCDTKWICMEGNTGIILMIHGGGFVTGYDGQMLEAAYYLVKKGFNAVLVNYRLAPENPFPMGAEDCFSVYCELLKQYSHNKIVVFGGSAGGNLALSTALQAKSKAVALPACVVAVAPTVAYDQDFSSHKENVGTDCMLGESFDLEIREMYLQFEREDILHNPFAAPYYGDWKNMMPVYLSVSDSEVLRDDSIYLADKLKDANVPYVLNVYHKKMHTFQLVPVLPEAKEALSDMVQFMKKYTN